jgi:hypothetical protein
MPQRRRRDGRPGSRPLPMPMLGPPRSPPGAGGAAPGRRRERRLTAAAAATPPQPGPWTRTSRPRPAPPLAGRRGQAGVERGGHEGDGVGAEAGAQQRGKRPVPGTVQPAAASAKAQANGAAGGRPAAGANGPTGQSGVTGGNGPPGPSSATGASGRASRTGRGALRRATRTGKSGRRRASRSGPRAARAGPIPTS